MKQRKEQAIANFTGIRVLKAIGDAVPVRLMKRDLLFALMQTFPVLNEWQLQTPARQHGIRKDRETDMLDKLFAAFVGNTPAEPRSWSLAISGSQMSIEMLPVAQETAYGILPFPPPLHLLAGMQWSTSLVRTRRRSRTLHTRRPHILQKFE